ncbi:D-aminoacyl-tRNA deacylase [Salinirubellus sp. GCM10025818]|uniref:D-aminoacyl-tRNA deacylase n=1 Tax=Salinirubellus TaxID=2162630 RepID=UPI0030D4386A
MLAIVVSRDDSASVHVGEHLRGLVEWTGRVDDARPDAEGGGRYYSAPGAELREFDDLHIHLERPAEAFSEPPDLLVFASRHAGDTGALLTAHTTGNFGPADYGGEPNALARAAPNALAEIHDAFERHAPDGYDVGMECTHHGPTEVGAPSLFAELGSGEDQWNDPAGAEAVARAVLDLRGTDPDRERQIVGFGGGHYVRRFERVLAETDWAVGHVAADWGLEAMGDPRDPANRAVIAAAFERSGATRALLDGDGDSRAIREAIEAAGYETVGERWLRETAGVPLDLVERAEDRLSSIDEGLRFGADSREFDGEFETATLPADLLGEAVGIDRERVRETVVDSTVAFESTENGTVPDGRIAVRETSDRESIVDDLLDVLREKYDSVEREDGAVTARTSGFDPEKARTLGVPEGPAFGRLAAGEVVEVEGREIPPEAVEGTTERRFDI